VGSEQRPFRERALAVIQCAFGGEHHVDKLSWHNGEAGSLLDSRCEFRTFGSLATWDYNELTRLVVAAHDYCVRADVRPAGRRSLGVMLSDRLRAHGDMPLMKAHPTLEDHAARIRGEIDSAEFGRRLKAAPAPSPVCEEGERHE
jgi:hypothetical protein